MIPWIFQDWAANAGNPRSRFVLALFRLAQACDRLPVGLCWLGWPCRAFYTLVVVWELGIELNYKARVGAGLRLYHGIGLVVHEGAVIGKNCVLRHGTTIGSRVGTDDVPVIGDGVDVGCQTVILGAIRIGEGARIGAGSVVVHDVAPGDSVAGNPARPLR